MAPSDFQRTPKWSFLVRISLPASLVFALGVFVMGQLADPRLFLPKEVASSAAPPSSGEVSVLSELSGARGGLAHWKLIYHFSTHVPEVCWGDNAVSEFQRRQCQEFWQGLRNGAILSALPFGCVWVFVMILMAGLRRVYRTARKQVAAQRPLAQGVVTAPAEAPSDFFSWLYGFQSIGVQLPKGGQVKVYVPRDATLPRPGQAMLVFEPFDSLGEKRHFGVLYVPHVAVVTGVRRGR